MDMFLRHAWVCISFAYVNYQAVLAWILALSLLGALLTGGLIKGWGFRGRWVLIFLGLALVAFTWPLLVPEVAAGVWLYCTYGPEAKRSRAP